MTNTTHITTGQPHWTVSYNQIDGAATEMPWQFPTEAEAKQNGEDWVADQPENERHLASYFIHKHEPTSYPAHKMGGRWVCDGPEGRFHAKTKRELVEMLKSGGAARV